MIIGIYSLVLPSFFCPFFDILIPLFYWEMLWVFYLVPPFQLCSCVVLIAQIPFSKILRERSSGIVLHHILTDSSKSDYSVLYLFLRHIRNVRLNVIFTPKACRGISQQLCHTGQRNALDYQVFL